jgi:hypothetical protein
MARHGWHTPNPPDLVARRFWTIALGTALEGYAMGRSATAMSNIMLEALGELGEARSAKPAAAPSLRLVTASNQSSNKSM